MRQEQISSFRKSQLPGPPSDDEEDEDASKSRRNALNAPVQEAFSRSLGYLKLAVAAVLFL